MRDHTEGDSAIVCKWELCEAGPEVPRRLQLGQRVREAAPALEGVDYGDLDRVPPARRT
jgi:hypothetical protein